MTAIDDLAQRVRLVDDGVEWLIWAAWRRIEAAIEIEPSHPPQTETR